MNRSTKVKARIIQLDLDLLSTRQMNLHMEDANVFLHSFIVFNHDPDQFSHSRMDLDLDVDVHVYCRGILPLAFFGKL